MIIKEMEFYYLSNYIVNCYNPTKINSVFINKDSSIIVVGSRDLDFFGMIMSYNRWPYFFRDDSNLLYRSLVDLWCVDNLGNSDEFRFEVNYRFNSLVHSGVSLVYAFSITESDYSVGGTALPTLTPAFPSSAWLEREVYDLFGIHFLFHPDLRRILTDYGFIGYPLRKDFPLLGYTEVRYDETKRQVVSEPVDFDQNFRKFNSARPWLAV